MNALYFLPQHVSLARREAHLGGDRVRERGAPSVQRGKVAFECVTQLRRRHQRLSLLRELPLHLRAPKGHEPLRRRELRAGRQFGQACQGSVRVELPIIPLSGPAAYHREMRVGRHPGVQRRPGDTRGGCQLALVQDGHGLPPDG
ncbi:hypothetical protein [Muricoccus radiodurans]|uniref:hypothetical protein n=1 Tax=Muricoccus radiodurans TaxID=2231721 RepID=UPI003CEE7235